MDMMQTIVALSHEFGTSDYVQGGGGNTSAKDAETLWVKPSGTTLGEIDATKFVAMDRARLARLYDATPPADAKGREELAKTMMLEAVLPGSVGRPSVEAPLHNSLNATYIVHTHPALVNGMTCGKEGKAACAAFFPDALWIDYVDPGYTLSMHVREKIVAYVAEKGREPDTVFLKNHGVIVAGDSAEAVRERYRVVMDRLKARYADRAIATTLKVGCEPGPASVAWVAKVFSDFEGSEMHVAASGAFAVAQGPISPDHIVYAKGYALIGDPTHEALEAYRSTHGYAPRVVSTDSGVFGVGTSPRTAALALDLARDGGLLLQLAEAFGGIEYMTQRAYDFIENWEVEAYRRKIAEA